MPAAEEGRFVTARKGDAMMIPFQCDLCHFRNIFGRNPLGSCTTDGETMNYVRRANLDSFWSRQTSTVVANMGQVKQMRKYELERGMIIIPERGPFPMEDTFGMGLAIVLLSKSLEKGRNTDYVQFETTRKLRTAFSNLWNASAHTPTTSLLVVKERSNPYLTKCPASSFWYSRFSRGFHERVGDQVIQDMAFSVEVMEEFMKVCERGVELDPRGAKYVEMGYMAMCGWLGALRGNEILFADLGGIVALMPKAKRETRYPHAPLVLQGKFKTSLGFTKHVFFLSLKTRSTFESHIGIWTERIVKLREREGRCSGWMFAVKEGKAKGQALPMSCMEQTMHEILEGIQERRPDLIPSELDVKDGYGIFRSFRRGATTEARNRRLPKELIDLNNGWRMVEASRGKHTTADMLAYYTELSLAVASLVRFSGIL